ncbi:YybH family protein [Actinomycetospora lemnae]|uniref:SgcJ/EcaC family oxidoreductase n=1 Tax=Actinomycetospora lemnae TaxID=3019891 RepID=A0ABT5T0V2_9PSEU|nr:SgcJ/EcaC family oxidoreductase [Actinomycetospora sp. DW7H6]MDD7968744.1 SgcJ/EcaC family oxidoreductase [Actinomycetospora sp. DW7H6]
MSDAEHAIRDLVERWARAVHAGDLDTVLADHSGDVVMFDVPPPHDGVRGIEAYAQTWPPFFDYQASGACFEIVELEVTAGDDVAFAHALLRCNTPEGLAAHPTQRLRLTLGLRREGGRWVVAHEHHSFPDETPIPEQDEEAVRAVHRRWAADTAAGDLEALVAPIADDVVSYEHAGKMAYVGKDEVREVCRAGLESSPGPVDWTIPDLRVVASGDLAVSWGIDEITPADGESVRSRGTRVFRRTEDGWRMVHQHLSFPAEA